uniref:SP110 nuclear antigen, tandem duplicate 1 n=1 Tax=Oreochromis niloticus TaxID=8128 RepID=A0A669DEE8_ORENI
MKKGEKGEIWTWPLYKSQLPVTCGQVTGTLQRDKLAKGQIKKCILANKQWFAPGEFERFAGKQSCKNWKLSIRCGGTPLGKLIKVFKLRELSPQTVFPPPGTLGKSIRTETSWMTPVDFCKESGLTNFNWKKDIIWDGKPLSALMEVCLHCRFFVISCLSCQENEKNDDECCICKNEEEDQELVVCEDCPRSFHQKCHLPHVDDIILKDNTEHLQLNVKHDGGSGDAVHPVYGQMESGKHLIRSRIIFQYDSDPKHNANAVKAYLNKKTKQNPHTVERYLSWTGLPRARTST